jgi:ADP-heptose:LPS heptosyltransferase
MFLPFLEELHASNPGAVLEVAVGKPMGSFLGKLTFLEQVHEIDVVLAATPPILYLYRRFLQMVRYAIGNFSRKQYDLCVLPRWGMDPFGSAYLGYLSNAPIAILYRAKFFLGNDSGPAHIAAGLGVPTVVVSVWPQGSAQEVRVIPVGPWVRTAHPQRCMPPCTESCSAHFAHCILTVDPADVFEQSRLLICQPG